MEATHGCFARAATVYNIPRYWLANTYNMHQSGNKCSAKLNIVLYKRGSYIRSTHHSGGQVPCDQHKFFCSELMLVFTYYN